MPRLHLTFISVIVIVILVLLIAGCGGASESSEETGQVRGLVMDVQVASLLNLRSLTLRDSEGKLWLFQGDSYQGISPSHLREHILGGAPITVSYRKEGDNLIITDISD